VAIRPEDLTISALPRSALPGGLKADAAAALLESAARDYRESLAKSKRLTETVEQQARRIEELEAQVASLEAEAAARKDPDELARTLLSSAQRRVRDQREEARRETELLLRKAARRAERIEQDARRRLEKELLELGQLDAFREEVSERLRSTLEAIVAFGDGNAGDHAA
jgi:cell division septum initiation protein DivIVA